MATSGSFNTGSFYGMYGTFTWSRTSVDTANARSTISWSIVAAGRITEPGVSYYYSRVYYLKIGDTVITATPGSKSPIRVGDTFASGTITIQHNTSTGAGSFAVDLKLDIWAGAPNCTGTATFTLDTIARASTFTATNCNIGQHSVIRVTRKNSAYSHSLHAAIQSETAYSAYINIGQSTTDSITSNTGNMTTTEVKSTTTEFNFCVPTSLYAKLPTKTSCKCVLTLKTYNGSSVIGTTTQEITLSVHGDIKPAFSITTTDNSESAIKNLTTNWVRYYSDIKFKATISNLYGSTVKSVTIGGVSVASPYERQIDNIESDKVTVVVTDNRGRSTSETSTGILIPYTKVTVTGALKRSSPTGSTGSITGKGTWYNAKIGNTQNTLTVKYRFYKKYTEAPNWSTTTATINGNEYTFNQSVSGLDYQSEYTMDLQVSDKLMTVSPSSNVTRGLPAFDFGRDDINFNVPIYMNGILQESIHSQGTTSKSGMDWKWMKFNSGLAICWGSYRFLTRFPENTKWGSFYITAELTPAIDYPFTFKVIPEEYVTLRAERNACWLYAESAGRGLNSTTKTAQYRGIRPTVMDEDGYLRLGYLIIGKWK